MTTKNQILTHLLGMFESVAKEEKKQGGTEDYVRLTNYVIDTFDGDLGDVNHLKNNVAYNLRTTYMKNGKKKTNWGYTQVSPVLERSFHYVNK